MVWKVLIADESDAIRSIGVNLFRQCGCELLTAAGGSEAWEILKSGKIDLAILNSNLSGMDGYTISKLIKEDGALAGIKTILLLSPSEIVNQHQLITARPDATLSKPFAPPDLLSRAGEVLHDTFELPNDYDKHELSTSVSEMEMSEDEVAEKIDFGAIFDESGDSSPMDDIHLTDVLDNDSGFDPEQTDKIVTALGADREPQDEDDSADNSTMGDDNTIHLADDQYGLEEPFTPPEVEVPHDYNWFIREMKNEISGKADDKKSADKKSGKEPTTGVFPKKPDKNFTVDDMDTTGKFTISEIGAEDSFSQPDKPSAVDELDKMITKASQKSKPQASGGEGNNRLSLAEKLLVQELARRLAERIISEISHKKLQAILDEVFEDLKKC